MIKWGSYIKLELLYLFLARLLVLVCVTTAAIPFGTFTPGLVTGSILGRFYGELLHSIYPFSSPPCIFAFAGTGAFIAYINKSFSISIIVLEMSGRFNLIFPMLLTTITSLCITSMFNISFFEIIINLRGLHYMPKMFKGEKLHEPFKKNAL